jgi:hypothetical protein
MRYDTQQDYEGRPRFDTEDAPAEATEASAPSTDVEADPEAHPEADVEADLERAEPEQPVAAARPAPVTDDDTAALWPDDLVQDFQQRWREVQWRFVDDPRAAADEAQALVNEALDRFSATVASRKSELDGWRDADGADTEQMRMVVRRYRNLLDRLLGM